MTAVPGHFEGVEQKLGHPQPTVAELLGFDEHAGDAAVRDERSGLPATWYEPGFDPPVQAAIPFKIRFNEKAPSATGLEPPEPAPVYLPADAVAVYAPWHFHRNDFGAYINGEQLVRMAARLAASLGAPFATVAPHYLRQIVLHEQAHFMFEVAATELEDLREKWLYRRYLLFGAGPAPPLTDGVPEEIWASWREVKYAKRKEKDFPELNGYSFLVAQELYGLPPGYSDFERYEDREEVRSSVASLMLGPGTRPVATGRWGGPSGKEYERMPLHWIGSERDLRLLGGLPGSP